MNRKIYKQLQDWKKQWNGETALLVDGARRVGKSWIVEEFAKNEYKSYILIDFNHIKQNILDLFEYHITDLDTFFTRLSLFTNIPLYKRESVIIFDEVQQYPKARAAIKYFVKDGRYDFIETGSLVSINHNVKDIVIPSEEIRINMYPMDFEEYMWAIGQKSLYDYIRLQYTKLEPLGQPLHRQIMEHLRTYFLVGGMPQAVLSYIKDKDFRHVDAIKRSIIGLYKEDISKYAGRQTANVTKLFNGIPSLLQRHEKKFSASKIKKGSRMRDFVDAMFWLNESRVALFCYGTTEPSVALAMAQDESKTKIYMADTGLLVSMAFDTDTLEYGGIYEKILRDKLEFNKGMLTENLIAQLLAANGHPLYFYSCTSRTDAESRMEIDFLVRKTNITSRHNVCPIEVKSSTGYALTSLNKFNKKFNKCVGTSYVFHTADLKVKDNVVYLPLYMAGLI